MIDLFIMMPIYSMIWFICLLVTNDKNIAKAISHEKKMSLSSRN